jgi:hypothetical protein
MDGLFTLANKLFGVSVEPADGLAPVSTCSLSFMECYFCKILTKQLLFRSGTVMSNFTVSKILPIALLLIFTLIHIQDHLKSVEGLG